MIRSHETIVVGAGPAGLATSRELTRAGVDHCVLERGDQLGHTWANLYDSLVLHTGRHLSALPGLAFPSGTPLFPPRRDFLDYLHRYASAFSLPIETSSEVLAIERQADQWIVRLRSGAALGARTLVVATGIVANPHVPEISGRDRFTGRVMHSVDYRRPAGMKGRRVLVVGAGNSAGEISVELARAGAERDSGCPDRRDHRASRDARRFRFSTCRWPSIRCHERSCSTSRPRSGGCADRE